MRVTNGQITGARRYTGGSNRSWIITVQPTSSQAIEVSLPQTADCQVSGSICLADGTRLSNSLTARIPLRQTQEGATRQTQEGATPSLTAEFRNVPTTHDGVSKFAMELHFSEHIPGLSYQAVRDSVLRVTNGQITGARRYTGGSNRSWTITVQPTSSQAIEVSLPQTADCQVSGSICLADGTRLSNSLTARIPSE